MKFGWQISYPPANGASLSKKSVFEAKFGVNWLTKTALTAKCGIFFEMVFVLSSQRDRYKFLKFPF